MSIYAISDLHLSLLLHIIETEQLDPAKGMIEWEGTR